MAVSIQLKHHFRAHYPDGTTSDGNSPYVGVGASDAEATAEACRAFISDEFDAGRLKPDRIEVIENPFQRSRSMTVSG